MNLAMSVAAISMIASFGVLSGCAASSNHGSAVRGSGASGGAGGSTIVIGSSTGGGLNLGIITPGTTADSDAGHPTRCDSSGHCSCIAIASIGHEGVWGPCSSDNTSAFQTWLNTQSTAHVDNYDKTKPMLTPEFLAQYDVIILQWMVENGQKDNDGAPWVFSADEIAALKDWVNKGGGVVALSGYQCEDPSCIQDIVATNQLLSFTDIQFNRDVVLSPNAVNTQDFYCWGGSVPLGAPIAPGIYSTGAWDQSSPIGAHVTDVGSYDARSITSTSATIDCSDALNHYAVHEQIGQGHVVAYGDEWVTYSGEWTGTSECLGDGGTYDNMYDPCYQKSPVTVFQIAQFWYNSIKYAASSVQCFDITDPEIVR